MSEQRGSYTTADAPVAVYFRGTGIEQAELLAKAYAQNWNTFVDYNGRSYVCRVIAARPGEVQVRAYGYNYAPFVYPDFGQATDTLWTPFEQVAVAVEPVEGECDCVTEWQSCPVCRGTLMELGIKQELVGVMA